MAALKEVPLVNARLDTEAEDRRDPGLTARMYFTMFMLGILYAIFAIVLWIIGVTNIVFIGVIVGGMALVQYFLSDRMILWATGAKLVTPQQEPELHRSIKRLADLDPDDIARV